MTRVCPDHNLPLQPRPFAGVTVDVCPTCAGVFFDEGEINRIRLDGNDKLTQLDESVTPAEDFVMDFREMVEPGRACPRCRHAMDKMRYLYSSPVVLDSCGSCGGVWVEDGELRHMHEVLDANQKPGTKVRTEAYVAMAELAARTDENRQRVKRLERAMRWINRRGSW